MNARRLIAYLLLNVVISAAATLTVLWLWDRTHAGTPLGFSSGEATATLAADAPLATQNVPVVAVDTPVPAATPTQYTVKAGDTLGTIATQFDVSVEEIMASNGITDPNVLAVGQTLLIPVAGYVPPTAPPATAGALPTNPVLTPLATATRDPNVALPELDIREVRGAGNLADEVLTIANAGGPVDLAGWSLRDETGLLYSFPALMLFEGGAVNLHTAVGSNTVTDLYWGQPAAVWASGKSVLLSDNTGTLHTRFTVP